MKLVCPQEMTEKQAAVLGVCLASADAPPSRDEMVAVLGRQVAAIEAGMAIVDRAFPIPRSRQIDLLGIDANGHPVLIFVDEELGTQAIGDACHVASWVEENIEAVAYLLTRGHLRRQARIWHIAVRIAPGTKALLSRVEGKAYEAFLCQRLMLGGEAWLVLMPSRPSRNHPSRSKSSEGSATGDDLLRDGSGSLLSMKSLLTEEEIDEFFEVRHPDGEEVTGSARIYDAKTAVTEQIVRGIHEE